MPTLDELIEEVQQQEKDLQFDRFTAETALEIGLALIGRAKQENLTIAIDIRRHGHQLFHYCAEGTTPDNDIWLLRKSNTVNRFNISSYLWGLKLKQKNRTFAETGLSPEQYAPWGGGFPINIRNVGVVGSIAVSGMDDRFEHELIVWAIKKILSK